MKVIRRLTTRISSSFDWIVRQVENHEALINCSIQEVAHYAAQAKVQLKRVEKDGQQLKSRIRELNESAVTWQERAKESKEKDKEKAIECLRRKKRAERELSALEVQLAEHSKTEVLLKKELSAVEGKLVELKRQRNIMRTRESNALARTTCGTREVDLVTEIADVFDRWEAKVTEYEAIADPSVTDFDDLEDQFATEEEHRELEAELQSLS